MKRGALLLVLSMAMAITSVPTANAGRRGMPRYVQKRSVSVGYNYVASSSDEPIQYNLADPVVIDVQKTERWTSIVAVDSAPRSVGVTVTQDLDDDGSADTEFVVCGATPQPVKIVPNQPLTVTPGPCEGEQTGATSGRIYIDLFSPTARPAAKVERTETFTYAGATYQNGDGGFHGGALTVRALTSESYIEVSGTDQGGLPTRIQIHPGEGQPFEICGATDAPVQIEPGAEIVLSTQPGPCADGTPAAQTTGTIEVTLSNAP